MTSILCAACLLSVGAAPRAQTTQSQPDVPPDIMASMQELWRRGRCLLSSVHRPAARESAVPKGLGSTPVHVPRLLERKGSIQCYAVHEQTIWAADDQGLYQVDGSAGKLIRRFDRSDGLPDDSIQSIAVAGERVWLATRHALAELDAVAATIRAVADVRFAFGRLARGASGTWLVSDTGVYRLAPGEERWRKLPDFPGQRRLARIASRGFWEGQRQSRVRTLLPTAFATADGLYMICLSQLLRCDPATGRWQTVGKQTWQAQPHGRTVWALTTGGVLRYDAGRHRTERFEAGKGLAAGRPVAIAATDRALVAVSHPDYDTKAARFVGGGISRLDLATGTWSVTDTVDGVDVRFATAVLADGDEAWVACTLYDRVAHLSAHPGMAHVKRWRPVTNGLGLLHYRSGRWTLTQRRHLPAHRRWVMGQRGTVQSDRIRPAGLDTLCRNGDWLWGVYRMVPERYYSGYFASAGCLTTLTAGRRQDRFDVRTDQLGLGGEQPELLLISHSHGERIVLAEGHPVVLGLASVAGRLWAVCQNGLFVHDARRDAFEPVVRVGFRFYWRATAAAAGKEAVWVGGDGGTVSRFDRRTGRLALVGVAPGRKVTAMAVRDGRVRVATRKTAVKLPVSLRAVRALPDADVLVFDGSTWSADSGGVKASASAYSCRKKGSYLYRGKERTAFLKGVFRPTVLCEDTADDRLWLATYSGVATVPLP